MFPELFIHIPTNIHDNIIECNPINIIKLHKVLLNTCLLSYIYIYIFTIIAIHNITNIKIIIIMKWLNNINVLTYLSLTNS